MKECLRCGKKNVDIHTCTPTKMYRDGIIEGIDLAREEVFKVRRTCMKGDYVVKSHIMMDTIDEALTNLVEKYAK